MSCVLVVQFENVIGGFSRMNAGADLFFALRNNCDFLKNFSRDCRRDYDHAIVVTNDYIARMDRDPTEIERDVDLARVSLCRRLGVESTTEDLKIQSCDVLAVANGAVKDCADNAFRDAVVGEQVSKRAEPLRPSPVNNQHISWLGIMNSTVDCTVLTGCDPDSSCEASDPFAPNERFDGRYQRPNPRVCIAQVARGILREIFDLHAVMSWFLRKFAISAQSAGELEYIGK